MGIMDCRSCGSPTSQLALDLRLKLVLPKTRCLTLLARTCAFKHMHQWNRHQTCRWIVAALAGGGAEKFSSGGAEDMSTSSSSGFCIIEGPQTVQDFERMELQEIRDNIKSRRNKIFLLMEEVRRLRIQQRIKRAEQGQLDKELENDMPEFPSSIPFFPPITSKTLKQYYAACLALIIGIVLFGGLLAPVLELKLGLGGSSYMDFIQMMHLPPQLSQVDPIVASFSGGAVGVISALMVVELNNVKQQEHKRCKYCHGSGYLSCASCSSAGTLVVIKARESNLFGQALKEATTQRCSSCSGTGKVMCPTCLCTGMALASEHDPRIDPFD